MPKRDKTPMKQSNDISHQGIEGLVKTTVGVLFRSDSGEEFYSETRYTLFGARGPRSRLMLPMNMLPSCHSSAMW